MNFPATNRRPFTEAARLAMRRLHMYSGLLLFPWAILYGLTAFLFNHPTVFNSQPIVHFGTDSIRDTPLRTLDTPASVAEQFVSKLNESQRPVTPYEVSGEARFNREYAFATVHAEGQTISLLIDAKSGHGQMRSQVVREAGPPETPPFIREREAPKVQPRGDDTPSANAETARGIRIANPLHERFKAAIPTLLEKHGFPPGEMTVTSVPDVVVPIRADGRVWLASFNPMTGVVTGRADDVKTDQEPGWRRFLLRLHTAHGYPRETNSRWWWAVSVDLMALVLCFWGLSGVTMWWSIRSQRRIGMGLLAVSAIAAMALGIGMHAAMVG